MESKITRSNYSNNSPHRLGAAGLLLSASCVILAACDVQQVVGTGPTNASVSASKNTSESRKPADQEVEGEKVAKASCGTNEMRLLADAHEPAAEMKSTKMQLIQDDGTVLDIASPSEMRDYTAVGISCAMSEEDGNPYFIVQYGELPWGCKFCEWFYIYDKNGKQLTKSVPVTLRDEALPDTQQQYPNNREYTVLAKSLRLPRTEMSYID